MTRIDRPESSYSRAEKLERQQKLNRVFARIYENDFERVSKEYNDSEFKRIYESNNAIEHSISQLGEDIHTYQAIADAFQTLGLDSTLTTSYEELEESDKEFLKKQCIIAGEDLISYLEDWETDSYLGFTREDIEALDENKIYSGKEAFNIIFSKVPENVTSKKGYDLYNNIEELEEKEPPSYSNSIKAKLAQVRDNSGEWRDVEVKTKGGKTKSIRKYKHSLNYYWDAMIEANPYMEDNEQYNKNKLFEEAAKEEGLWKYFETQYVEKLIEYDFSKAVTANSRTARNNLIFELMRHRLMDKETLKDRLTPGGFDNSKDSALFQRILKHSDISKITIKDEVTGKLKVSFEKINKLIEQIKDKENPEKDPEPNYDAADPATLLFYNQLNQIAAKLIGVFANQNTNHQLSSIIRKLDMVKPIIFDGMIGAKVLKSAERLDGISEQELAGKTGKSLLLKEVQLSDGRIIDIDLNLAEFLAASVDAVKDPVLNYLNFNTITASAGALLARMGYSTKDIGILFNQPIIKDLCNSIQNSGGIKQFNTAKREILSKYLKQTTFPKDVNTRISSEELAMQLIKYRDIESNTEEQKNLINSDKEFVNLQVGALKIFEDAYNGARELNDYISTTKFTAANAVGSGMGFFYNQYYTIENYINRAEKMLDMVIYESRANGKIIDKSLNTSPKDMSKRKEYIQSQKENPYAFEQCMYDLNRELLKILEKYYPYNKPVYAERREAVSNLLSSGNVLDADTIDDIHRETSQHFLAFTDSAFNPNAECEEDSDYNNRDYYLYKFPLELFKMRTVPGYGNIPDIIAKYINFAYKEVTNRETGSITKQLHISINLNIEQTDKNTFTDAWAFLARGNEYQQKIAKGLFFHNYYKLGFNVGPFSFSQFTPLEVKELLEVNGVPYLDYISIDNLNKLDAVHKGTRIPQYAIEFAYQFALNHVDNYQLVHRMPSKAYSIDGSSLSSYKALFKKSLSNPNEHSFTLDLTNPYNKDLNNNFIMAIDDSSDSTPIFKVYPIIKYGNDLYAAQVFNSWGNITTNSVTYKKVPALGKKSIFNTYAETLEEAIELYKRGTSVLEEIEHSISEDLQKDLEKHEEDRNKIFEEMSEAVQEEEEKLLTLDDLIDLPKITHNGQSYIDVTSLLSQYIQKDLEYLQYSDSPIGFNLERAKENAEKLGFKNVITHFNTDSPSVSVIIPESNYQSMLDTISEGTSDAFSSVPEGYSDNSPIDVDYEDLYEKLISCHKVTEDLLINTMLDIIVESGKAIDRDSVAETLKDSMQEESDKIIARRKANGERVSTYAAKIVKREVMIETLVDNLKTNIQSGKTKVYTRLTNEQIC